MTAIIAKLSESTNIKVNMGQVIDNGSELATFIRRSDYVHDTLTAYTGYALEGSSESSSVWTITVLVTLANGDIDSTTQHDNVAWTDRYSL